MNKTQFKPAVLWSFISLIVLFFLVAAFSAREGQNLREMYERAEVMIPMRDGVRLHTYIYTPIDASEALPFLMQRTPYGAEILGERLFKVFIDLAEENYIFIFQDLRGRYGSEGDYVFLRTPADKTDPKNTDEGTDTHDTIAWLIKNIQPNNGRVGMFGFSYGGWTAIQALINPHSALKAISPQAIHEDMFIYDDMAHNGAFRLAPAFGYSAATELGKTVQPFQFDQHDVYEFFLDLGALHNVNDKYFREKVPSWNNFLAHPNHDAYWKRIRVTPYLEKPIVPTLFVAGWWDAENFAGTLQVYHHLEKRDEQNHNYVVIGPWRHGGWASTDGNSLGEIEFDSRTGEFFKREVEAQWFAYHLKGKGELNLPEALTFQTGSNKWEHHRSWPPTHLTKDRNLYFDSDGKLSFTKSRMDGDEAYDCYVSDPAKPVPYTKRPIAGFWQSPQSQALWKVEDQRFVHLRPDVLCWETEKLEEDTTITGNIAAHLFASTTGTDTDWIVKLIDVFPENYSQKRELSGYQLMIADEVFRAKFRNSYEEPEPVKPDEIIEYVINLHERNHCFRKGHKIMVQVQSTWFPLIDRNPQKFIDIPKASNSDYQIATQKIFRSAEHSSHIVLPVRDNQSKSGNGKR
jgi:putative CocE/NonD family hydrolase